MSSEGSGTRGSGIHGSGTDEPVLASRARAWGQDLRYRVYPDRVELDFRILIRRTFVIPAEDVVDVWVSPPTTLRSVRRMGGVLAAWRRGGLKLDLADLFEHVGLQRRPGRWPEFFFFVPEDPRAFASAIREISP